MQRRRIRTSLWVAVLVGIVSPTGVGPALALSRTVAATAAGWFRDDGTHNAANGNYLSGWDGYEEFRDFFLFDLSAVSGVVTGATLRVNSGQVLTADPSETVTFYEVTTPAADLQVSQNGRTDIFDDLGDGTVYGAAGMPSTLSYTTVDVPLNASGISAVNAGQGGMFALGGTVTTLSDPPFDQENVFANTSQFLTRQLLVQYVGCTSAPLGTCRSPQKSSVALAENSNPSKDKALWKWKKGQASPTELADPTAATGYALCIYAGTTGAQIAGYAIPGGAHWQAVSDKGYKYDDHTGTAAGIQKIILKGSATDKAKALVKGRGAHLPAPPLGNLPLPVTVQLVNQDTGLCLQAVYDTGTVIRSDPKHFTAAAP